MRGGKEIRLFDPRRTPADWVDLMSPTGCAVFFKNAAASIVLNADGRPFPNRADTTCMIFDRIDVAQRFCEEKVRALPHLRCEIFNAKGLAVPPLLVVLHPDLQRNEDGGTIWSRRRKLFMALLLMAAVPLFWLGAQSSTSSDLAIFLGINCVVLALRFLYWDVALQHRERDRAKRLEEQRKLERPDAAN